MHLLAIETSTEVCSVALLSGESLIARHEFAPRRHAELVLPWIDGLLAEAGLARAALDLIAVGIGPGAFTGVRLAVALGHGLALGLDRPLLGVSTLDVLAAGALEAGPVLACLDARMGEIYAAEYVQGRDGTLHQIGPSIVMPPSIWEWQSTHGCARGTGLGAANGVLGQRLLAQGGWTLQADALPHAADLARLALARFHAGEVCSLEQVQPIYLRDKVAQTLAERGMPLPAQGVDSLTSI
ncbi:MAG: tRNA (adenosine(37)-N6)-threonylcarbamoyltransferase complex dimerization subunit type 1 TsaB [Aquimonas sp.]|jgi:tRNA threonylcarbamoyladenosine biosynthesis protein TsaB|nr:tRNA (adenosine(37)-N6)-threonylcarbamoyltransferase complex dimerization subunit type 1 TsaB [Xanthomonadales bacterium]MCC6506178.1 tRNA (adenosine(37)-N6)-threonylcarbamoyltransferase complex dimerization subunit type 1 TsaB [Aquimonas sp.]